jgi:hypothetical protein
MKEYIQARCRGVFNAEAIRTLVDAFDEAWQSVRASGGVANATDAAREVIATYFVEAALLGERDRRRLCDGALKHLAKVSRATIRRAHSPRPGASNKRTAARL